jgi:hypothetical protein
MGENIFRFLSNSYRRWVRIASLVFVSYRALVPNQSFYQFDFALHRSGPGRAAGESRASGAKQAVTEGRQSCDSKLLARIHQRMQMEAFSQQYPSIAAKCVTW